MKQVDYLQKLVNGVDVEWKMLGDIISTITAPVRLKKDAYQVTGVNPIIDQSVNFIAGYSNDDIPTVPNGEYIIFGDHTETIKYIDFAFVQGADGLKILRCKDIETKFVYYAFQNYYIKEKKYKRHWNKAKKTLIPIPPLSVQKEIVRILDAFTELTNELTNELTMRQQQYNHYRDTLLDFSDKDVEWKTLGEVAKNLDSERKPITSSMRVEGSIPYYGASGIIDYVEDYIFDGDFLLVSEDGANLVARRTPIAFSICGKSWVNNHAHILQFDTHNDKRFIEFYLNNIDLTPYISGAAQPKLNQKNLNSINVPRLAHEEQARIVAILDKFDTLTNSISEGLPREIELRQKQYAYYRDLLLNFPKPDSLTL